MLFGVLGFIVLALQGSAVRSVELWSEHPIVVTVEWLTIEADGETSVHERRDVAVETRASINYTSGARRFVRFSYPGASPHTYPTSELALYKTLRVPDALPGGELFFVVPKAAVRPTALVLDGPRVRTLQIREDGTVRLAGLPAGRYLAAPVYEGGMKGEAQAFFVAATRSTIAFLPPEDVGAVRVVGESAACAPASTTSIYRLFMPDTAAPIKSPPNRGLAFTSTDPRCDFVVGGLSPGPYEAVYSSPQAVTGSATFDIIPQRITIANVGGTRVVVSGHATLNGRALAGVKVGFIFLGSDTSPAGGRSETRTDGAGYYRQALDAPGRYQIAIISTDVGLYSQQRAELVAGDNTFHLALAGGTLTAEIVGWDRKRFLQIEVRGNRGEAMSTLSRTASNTTKVFSALPFGTYSLSVPGFPDATREVTISAARPEATVTLDLSKR